ncbi:MAG: hypothetical protein LC101_11985 [Flavobacteriales bacterium]|nr:hypothetical protein [Flavobacteriales bacterium]MCZ2444483.1 hypothetical protein [Flavobacteriales bacterium]
MQKDKGLYFAKGIYTQMNIQPFVLANHQGFITIKGETIGHTRDESEYAIPFTDAEVLLNQFCQPIISKIRYRLPYNGKTWDVDAFLGDNEGLILAE